MIQALLLGNPGFWSSLFWTAAAGIMLLDERSRAPVQPGDWTGGDDAGPAWAPGSGYAPGAGAMGRSGGLLSHNELIALGVGSASVVQQKAMLAVTLFGSLGAPTLHAIGRNVGSLVSPFRRSAPPMVTGRETEASLAELVADAVAGARVPVASLNPRPGGRRPILVGGEAVRGGNNPGPNRDRRPEVDRLDSAQFAPTDGIMFTVAWAWSAGGTYCPVVPGSGTTSNSGSKFDSWGFYAVGPVAGFDVFTEDGFGTYNCGYFQSGVEQATVSVRVLRPGGSWEHVITKQVGTSPGQNVTGSGWSSGWVVDARALSGPGPNFLITTNERQTTVPYVGAASAPARPPLLPPAPAFPAEVPAADPVPQPAPAFDPAKAPQQQPATLPAPVAVPSIPGTAVGPGRMPARPAAGTATTTPPGNVYPVPGAKPIVANPVQPTLQGIATELGNLEQKLHRLLQRPDSDAPEWMWLLWQLAEAVLDQGGGGQFELRGACERDQNDNPTEVVITSPYAGGGSLQRIESKVAALVPLLQAQKDLRQPICRDRRPRGRDVTVNFRQIPEEAGGNNGLMKRLSYKDPMNNSEAAHVAHWLGFEWQAGPVIVGFKGSPMGQLQVWAASEGEGRRVISHACAICGVDPLDGEYTWNVATASNPRYGKPGTMRVVRWDRQNRPMISSRDSASGSPGFMRDP